MLLKFAFVCLISLSTRVSAQDGFEPGAPTFNRANPNGPSYGMPANNNDGFNLPLETRQKLGETLVFFTSMMLAGMRSPVAQQMAQVIPKNSRFKALPMTVGLCSSLHTGMNLYASSPEAPSSQEMKYAQKAITPFTKPPFTSMVGPALSEVENQFSSNPERTSPLEKERSFSQLWSTTAGHFLLNHVLRVAARPAQAKAALGVACGTLADNARAIAV